MSFIRCCPPIVERIEYEIDNYNILPINNSTIILPTQDVELCPLKQKVICEYQKIISELEKGKKPSLTFLIDEISSITISNDIDSSVLQYYLNNKSWKI